MTDGSHLVSKLRITVPGQGIWLSCLAVLLLAACAGRSSPDSHSPAESAAAEAPNPRESTSGTPPVKRIQLKLGASTTLGESGATLRFSELVADSRCPLGVTCVWAGEVSLRFQVLTEQGGTDTFDLILGSSGPAAATRVRGDVTIQLMEVRPYPRDGVPNSPAAYIAILEFRPRQS